MIYHGKDRGGFGDLEREVHMATSRLRRNRHKFDAIAVSGVSGMSVGFPLALKLKVPIAVVRKATDDTHSSNRVEGGSALRFARVLFVDDFIINGGTKKRVREAVATIGGRVVGSYEYRDNALTWETT